MVSTDPLRRLDVLVASGDALDVRNFHVVERMSKLFEVTLLVRSENPDIDFESVAGQPMSFSARQGLEAVDVRSWSGICSHIEQLGVEERGLSTYKLVLSPALWLLTQRRNYRIYQLLSEVDIARKLLDEWNIPSVWNLSATYKKRKYRVQYGESDFTFVCRMLEDAGVSFYFHTEGAETKLVLHDAPQSNAPRSSPIAFRDQPTDADREHITDVRIGRRVRPGKYTVRDHDYRRPASYDLRSSAKAEGGGVEESLERFHYVPGAFLFESDKGEASPAADDKGRFRTDEKEAASLAQRRLDAKRAAAKTISFDTNTIDLAPGTVVSFLDHPKSELAPGKELLVIRSELSGQHSQRWTCSCEAVSASSPFHPPLNTRKPRTSGVESATVVGPPGEEIHTDEFGRVRVHFHWDRESKMDDASSCWIHVSQPWGGAGFGGSNLPRVGQEVIVDFLGGDPDRPIIIGRVYTNLQKTPYKLPDNKTQSGWQSRSSPGGGASNYNEIMFEDKKGQELLRMQAEKNLDKLVKNDESVRIGHDRGKQVGHDDALAVGNDRSRQVGHDETIAIGNDRSRQVGHDETVAIGNDRTRMVGNNEAVTVGNNRTKSIGTNESLFVGANQSEQIGANRSVQVGANHAEVIGGNKGVTIGQAKVETVALASAETVGLARALTIGTSYAIKVGASMSTEVGESQAETVALTKTVTVGEKIKISCGSSSITMDKEGNIVVYGTDVTVQSDGPITVKAGGDVFVEAATNVNVRGNLVHMN